MKNKSSIAALAATVAILAAFSSTKVEAVSSPTLEYSVDGGVTWVPIAGSGNTVFASPGNVGGWDIVSLGGVVTGSPVDPTIDLDTLDLSGGSGTLLLQLSATGFGPTDAGFAATFGGNVADSVTWSGYVDAGNTLFAHTTQLFSNASLSGSPLSSSAYGGIDIPGSYSMTEEFAITANGSNFDSLDGKIAVPDGGMTVALLGLSLAGLAGAQMLRKKLSV